MSFDPAATEMGIAVADYHRPTGTFMVLYTESIIGAKLLREYKWMRPLFTQAFCVQTAYYHHVKENLIATWKPDEIVSEGAFYHHFAATLISLTLVINTIRQASRDTLRKDIRIVAPTETKLIIAGKGSRKEKDLIRNGVLGNENIKFAFPNSDVLTEHEYDAIGHGYTFCVKVLPESLLGKKKK